MLRQRVVTAVVLAVLGAALIGLTGVTTFALLAALVALLAAGEFARLAAWDRPLQRAVLVLLVAAALALGAPLAFDDGLQVLLQWLLGAATLWWILPGFWMLRYPAHTSAWSAPAMRVVIAVWVLSSAWVALVTLKTGPGGERALLFLIGLVASADIGAYACGRTWGRAKLIPQVSPGKTWAGVGGGLAAAMAFSVGVLVVCDYRGTWWGVLASVAVAVVISVLGDLLISLFKRHVGLKDSSHLLPGHGGLLDRLDSLLAAAPWVAWSVKFGAFAGMGW